MGTSQSSAGPGANVSLVPPWAEPVLPEHDRAASLFYPDKHGNLSRSDPNQLSFDSLREVPAAEPTHTNTTRQENRA